MDVWKRLVYRTPGKMHNFLMYPFLLMTASYGVALTFFQHTTPVQESILYSLTVISLPESVLSVWGVVALVVSVVNFVALILRKRSLGTFVSMLGFLLWLYAFWLYLLNYYVLQLFFAAIPNLMFWGWYYVSINKFHNNEDDLLVGRM